MEHIAEITGTLCVAVVIMGILYNIGCFTATEKVIKFVISVIIPCLSGQCNNNFAVLIILLL